MYLSIATANVEYMEPEYDKKALIILKMYNVVYIIIEKIISICENNIMFSYPSKLFELKVKHRALDMGIRCRHSIVIVVRSRIEVG